MAYSTATLAQGCFGKVYKEKYNGTWAAVKKVPHHLISRKDLERECEVYNKVKHTNIVKLLGNITLKEEKWIIPMEFIFGEDLETTIFNRPKSKIQLTPIIRGTIVIGMCEGLRHLHSKDVVHQDLKPDNIMVEHKTNRAVIIDLGLAKFFRHGLNSAMDMGNEAYSAPEVLQRGGQRDQRSDVWAMGKIIFELSTLNRLPPSSICPAKIEQTMKGHLICHLLCRMVETNPSLRASMAEVVSEIQKARGAEKKPLPPKLDQPPKPKSKAVGKQAAALVPAGKAEITQDLMKLRLHKEAAKDLPCNLPTTGRVMVQHYEQKNEGAEIWEQKAVETCDGKIVKYSKIKLERKLD